jgi:phage FluMu gp28-like protein
MRKILLPYQRRFLKNARKHKYAIWNAGRQIGKSFTISYDATDTAISKPKSTIIVVSASERQAVELLNKVKQHVELFAQVEKHIAKTQFFEDVDTNVHKVVFPNGSRIISVPANPDTVRGFTADLLILDEFAFVKHDRELWAAVFPMITRRPDARVVITSSSPKDGCKESLFYKLFTEAENSKLWYAQKTTILDAVKEGLDIDLEALREGIKDEDLWRAEYLCECLDTNSAVLPYEWIQACELPKEEILVSSLEELSGDIFVGVDIGRRRDYTVIAVLEKVASVLFLRKLEVLEKVPFRKQFQILDYYASKARRVAIDETGIGMQIAEELQTKWGDKVLKVYFTAKVKEELAELMRIKFQDRLIRIPEDADLREDLHSVRKTLTPSGNIKIEGSTKDSHADRFWALALAIFATNNKKPSWSFKFLRVPWV